MPVYCDGRPCDRGPGIAGDTPEGGRTVALINKTGAASVKGTLVRASSTANSAFEVAPTSSDEPIGVVLDDGIPDGSYCRVVIAGRAQVLLEDGVAATRGYWIESSATVAGRVTMSIEPVPATHWGEVGHCLEEQASGTDVLAWCILHFN
jgi:hypothetical protein